MWKYFIAAIAAGLLCWVVVGWCPVTSVVLTGFGAPLRVTVVTILCVSLYLAFLVALYRGFAPISQFMVILHELKLSRSADALSAGAV